MIPKDAGPGSDAKTLAQIFAEHQGKVSDKWSLYLEVYDRVFAPLRRAPVRLLEIGVQNGGSLEIWSRFFPNARALVGVDINDGCRGLSFTDERITLVVGDANADDVAERILEASPRYDIIIDDGSHTSSDVITCFARYFPALAEGGVYIVEDAHCSYWDAYEGGLHAPYSSMAFFKRLADVLNAEHWGIPHRPADLLSDFARRYAVSWDERALSAVHSIELLNSLCVVRKSDPAENVLGPRRIAGHDAAVYGAALGSDGQTSVAPDQSGNIWSSPSILDEEASGDDPAIERLRTALRDREAELGGLRHERNALRGEVDHLRTAVAAREAEVKALGREQSMLRSHVAGVEADRRRAVAEEKRLHDVLDAIYASTSWRLSAPIRAVRHGLTATSRLASSMRAAVSRPAYAAWHWVPASSVKKQRFKSRIFKTFPSLFRGTRAYRTWESMNAPADAPVARRSLSRNTPAPPWVPPATSYIPLLDAAPLADPPVRVVAFYLPQFHPIPENDAWWGKDFTEWANVRPARPQFAGHYQPHVPGELGYYDLRDTSVLRRQIELARLYGIGGFCFYFYWFSGKRLLEAPVDGWLDDKSLDFPFCLCWANESWSRTWDGREHEILIEQKHTADDDLVFIQEISRFLRDPRYIRVNGKPLLLVYRPDLLPSAADTARRWRRWCRDHGVGDIFLACTQSFDQRDPRRFGFDAAVEFPPNNSAPPNLTSSVTPLSPDFAMTVFDWNVLPERSETYDSRRYPIFRSVCPGWDNTARKRHRGTAFVNNTPARYQAWLENAIRDTVKAADNPTECLVFVNAWNEWAEGAHLEPDEATGYAYLQATRNALARTAAAARRVVVVTHDAHPHGAQLIALNMARGFRDLGFEPDVIVLGGGPLLPRFAEVATVHAIDLGSDRPDEVAARLRAIRAGGAEIAIVNSTVSGALVPRLAETGFFTVSVVHELPGILRSYGLEGHAAAIARHSDRVVFTAPLVREGFEQFVGTRVDQAVIRSQGSYMRVGAGEAERLRLRDTVRRMLGLPLDARIVLGAGYADHRKGVDLFVDVCVAVLQNDRSAVAVWVGHHDAPFVEEQMLRVRSRGMEDRFVFTGRVREPQEYFVAADVFALTSREDPFPSVVMEALEATLPVVAFGEVTGAADLLARGCGEVVPPFDAKAMAAAILNLLADDARARQYGRCGRAIVRREYAFTSFLQDLLALTPRPVPRVSVVVPSYNYARYIRQRLASITEQTVPPYEIIVLDDASTDGSVEVVEAALSSCPLAWTVVVNDTNSGSVWTQWRRGAAMARGDFLWIAEADDLADPGFLAEVLAAFERPDVVMSYCQSRQIDAGGHVLARDYLDYLSDVDPEHWKQSYLAAGPEEVRRALFLKNTIPNVSAVVFRRDALLRVLERCADEITSFRHTGDWLAYVRLLESGSLAFSPRSLNSHRRHPSSVTVGNFGLRHLQEVMQVQRDTIARYNLGAPSRDRADRYAQRLYEQFGLATDEYPTIDTRHELKDLVFTER